MTAAVSNRRDQDPFAANEIGHVKRKSGKIDASKPAGTLSPKKRLSDQLSDHGRTDALELRPKARTQAGNALFVVSRSLLDLRHRVWQELQNDAHGSGAI
jgi:hypothetical protein